ncbi:hypothetical protein P170DRAFT_248419 [Aspergillus steynii IBT 23096]|uniref:Uncharacterized protein n=1 Tax=Aspergillus steynii IBT 23096 TaxID=1392250 RepID=A0A2I2FYD6_9EURO|nr:uncharacterized protein P170DRAFT_248419 [Aspergillus steynii IBT 23096]PLB45649.1 hypothetical protein P170DRAFT_248419 [Aspergillus steynii IBT 23096]
MKTEIRIKRKESRGKHPKPKSKMALDARKLKNPHHVLWGCCGWRWKCFVLLRESPPKLWNESRFRWPIISRAQSRGWIWCYREGGTAATKVLVATTLDSRGLKSAGKLQVWSAIGTGHNPRDKAPAFLGWRLSWQLPGTSSMVFHSILQIIKPFPASPASRNLETRCRRRGGTVTVPPVPLIP